ncbi:MAG: hypothetical protein U9Q83_08675, partial [Bacteroidota bacterium]|nr:hypothetical protein [Bacteroidota bacterium]
VFNLKVHSQEARNIDSMLITAVEKFQKLKVSDNDSLTFYLSSSLDSLLISIFSDESSYNYDFSDLKKHCSILKSDDGLMQIISWNIYISTGEYFYFGYIQYKPNKSDEFYFYELKDVSASIENPKFSNLNTNKWYGCIYYDIIEQKEKKKTIYTLLAWDGNNRLTNKKIVEVISFRNNKPNFGYNFDINGKKHKRLIFEYNKRVSMTLRWDEKMKVIVWDHLAPKELRYREMYQFYGPDFTYDALKFEKRKWVFIDNIVVTNLKEE